jgi:ABC-type Fe3+ transport system permease subunit
MKSTFKKIAAMMLVVPMLVLGIGVLGATPAYAASNCPSPIPSGYTNSTGCDIGGGVIRYYLNGTQYPDQNAWKAANKEACKPDSMKNGINCSQGNDQPDTLFGDGGIVTTIINVLLFIIGILCVIMIIFGGIRYTTSTGDKGRVDGAKNTIIYAVVGLIVAIVAYALVNWVFNSVTGS